MRVSIILLLILACFTGCRNARPYPSYMRQAERVMKKDPDSAVRLLNRCRDSVLAEPDSVQVAFLLLRINAGNLSDSTFTTADAAGLPDLLKRHRHDQNGLPCVYYYAARVYYDLQDQPQSLEYALRAQESVTRDTPLKLKSSISQLIALIYQEQNMPDKSLPMYLKSLRYRLAARDSLPAVYLYRQVAWLTGN